MVTRSQNLVAQNALESGQTLTLLKSFSDDARKQNQDLLEAVSISTDYVGNSLRVQGVAISQIKNHSKKTSEVTERSLDLLLQTIGRFTNGFSTLRSIAEDLSQVLHMSGRSSPHGRWLNYLQDL